MNVDKIINEMMFGIKNGTLNLNHAFKQISEYAENYSENLNNTALELQNEVKEELEFKLRNWHLDEALDSIEKTLKFISSIKIVAPEDVNEGELETSYEEYKNTLNSTFKRIGSVNRDYSRVMAKLKEYATSRKNRVEYDAKMEFREALRKYLEKKRDEIQNLNFKIEQIEPIERLRDVNIDYKNVNDLVKTFELEKLNIEELEKDWISKNEQQIIEKVERSLEPKLNSSMLHGVNEGWRSKGGVSRIHDKKTVLLAPEYAKISEEGFDYLLRGKGRNVTIYKLIFGIDPLEVSI